MTEVHSTGSQQILRGPGQEPEGLAAASGAGFAAIFAQFAQHASLHAAASGRLSLGVGGKGASVAAAMRAQKDAHQELDPARERTTVREPEQQTAGNDRRAAGAERPRSRPPDTRGTSAPPSGGSAHGVAPTPGERPEASAPSRASQSAVALSPLHGLAHAAAPPAPVNIAAAGGPKSAAAAATARIAGVSAAAGTSTGPLAGLGPQPRTFGAQAAQASARGSQGAAPRDAAAFRAQLAHGLGAALRRGEGEVTLRLRPAMLGDLRVSLSVKGSSVEARIHASTAQAHRLLEQSVDVLRSALEARGLHAGRIEIESGPGDSKSPEAFAGGGGSDPFAHGSGERETPEDPAWERATGGGAAPPGSDPQDDGSGGARALGGRELPGVVYGVADGAARIIMVDALA